MLPRTAVALMAGLAARLESVEHIRKSPRHVGDEHPVVRFGGGRCVAGPAHRAPRADVRPIGRVTGDPHVRVRADELSALVEECFVGVGVRLADARAVADVLVYADLRRLDAHGVHRVPAYMRRVRHGLAGGTEQLREVAGSGAIRRLDACHALGPAAAVRATDLAVALARVHGIGLVALGRSTHFGAAGFYARRAARERLVALVLSNGPKAVAPFGAAEAFTGTNPLALGIPLGRYGEFVLDMSTSALPRERIRRLASAGRNLPAGVAIDVEGRPTRDPSAALGGSVLPVGGPKGSGLGLGIALLAGLLGGADFDYEIGSMVADLDRPQNVGQVFVAADPGRLTEQEESSRRAEALVDALHRLRAAEGFERVLFSGEGGDARARQRAADGIPLACDTLERVADACEEARLAHVAEHARRLACAG
jgi:LDH2 family malate/lactate/ureidoglycolate dehydrogenase